MSERQAKRQRKLLTRGASSPKLTKGSEGVEAVILHLAPGRTCPWASEGCLAACLNTAGRGAMNSVQAARQRRTDWFFEDRVGFLCQLDRELGLLEKRAKRKGVRAVARLNGTSDIPWENISHGIGAQTFFERHPMTTFYDYTKSRKRAVQAVSDPNWPENYSLTLSRTEDWRDGEVATFCELGINVAIVFSGELPEFYEGVEVIDGRKDDWRFRDPKGVVVGLSALGKAKRDTSGFVVR